MSDAIREAVRSDLLARSSDWCATKWLLEAIPHVFEAVPADQYWDWKNRLAAGLGVDAKNIVVTGSSAVGVSLSPYKGLRSFDGSSDIDVAVISTYHFDVAWRTLRNLGTQRYRITTEQAAAVKEHVNRFIYWGTIATDRLLPLFPFADGWMEALGTMAQTEPTVDRDIKVRIYRDFASLRAYMNMGIKSLQNILIAGGAAAETKIN
jgi:hypothetical protein